uniref:PWWP domain-containing protein 2B n=5 Tax=Lygus hesperus TaxID=30085 RepID=A0A0A9YNJ6_LYGHE
MAESQIDTTVMLTTNSKILVTVDEALQDIIVVSYAVESKLFQGVLLDSTKRYLPCKLDDAVKSTSDTKPEAATEEDKLYFSVRQRFTYFQEKHVNHIHLQKKVTSKSKNQKMTVRLRPRQVLCSKCKSICNENSENVNSNQTRSNNDKNPEPPEKTPPRPLFTENRSDNLPPHLPNNSPPKLCPSFVPRFPRISQRISENTENSKPISNGSGVVTNAEEEFWMKPQEMGEEDGREGDDEDDRQMVLRKKRSVGSMEDLWDETVFEEGGKKAKTTPVIKISFGSQGEGTVVKIPPKIQGCESEAEEKPKSVLEAKAAKKAMKKAKKEAKKKTFGSPMRTRRSSTPESDALQYRKHRHKMKHRKKHKADKPDEEIKERCLKQKLSINLKRVTPTTYEKAESSSSGSDSASPVSEEVPDFPAADPIEGTSDVNSCKTTDGSVVAVGDIVWGKIQGCPWWPGKILNILIKSENNSWHAHVSWYGSTTSSMMPCDQLSPFLQTFKVRYNKRKKSAGYKEAIRQATTEASASNPDLPVPEGVLAEETAAS